MQVERGFTDNWLQPTGEQENLMRQYAGCKRFVWNRALSIEQARYRRGEKKQLGQFAMMRQLTMWRNNPDPHSDFLKDAPVHALQCVLYHTIHSHVVAPSGVDLICRRTVRSVYEDRSK